MRLNRGRHSAVTASFKSKRYRSQFDVVVCIDCELAPPLGLFDVSPQNIFLVCVVIRADKKSKSWRFFGKVSGLPQTPTRQLHLGAIDNGNSY
jgi:hypothetical protein